MRPPSIPGAVRWPGPIARQRPRAVRADRPHDEGPRDPARAGGPDRRSAGGRVGYGGLWRAARRGRGPASDPQRRRSRGLRGAGREDAERLAPLVGTGDVVLDLGCGIGRVARYVAPLCRTLWAVDASEDMLGYARRRLAGVANVRFARSEGTRVPGRPDDAVDVAYSLITLQHLEREDAFALLRDLRRMVRPGGRLYVTFPNLLSDVVPRLVRPRTSTSARSTNPARARIYTPQEVERLLPAAGFDDREARRGRRDRRRLPVLRAFSVAPPPAAAPPAVRGRRRQARPAVGAPGVGDPDPPGARPRRARPRPGRARRQPPRPGHLGAVRRAVARRRRPSRRRRSPAGTSSRATNRRSRLTVAASVNPSSNARPERVAATSSAAAGPVAWSVSCRSTASPMTIRSTSAREIVSATPTRARRRPLTSSASARGRRGPEQHRPSKVV